MDNEILLESGIVIENQRLIADSTWLNFCWSLRESVGLFMAEGERR